MDDDLRYPVGRFDMQEEVTPERRREWIEQVAEAPARLREAVAGRRPSNAVGARPAQTA